ncbi:MAG: ABC transporter permease [Candidatus Brocadiae bacterium]|nr:ABC transporter permease [Candidatus Brocadiia bacterium]
MGTLGRIFTVWRRNLDVYRVTWKVNFLPPILEPIFYLVAFSAGLGGFVGTVPYDGREVTYTAFIAPGMLGISVMFQGFFECTYGSYIRMYYQKTFDAIIATPISLDEVILGELFWGATKALIASSIMCVVIRFYGLLTFPDLLAIPVVAFIGGFWFACLGMCFTSITPGIDAFNYPMFLVITPMMLLSGTYFPLSGLPAWGQTVAQAFPLTHLVEVIRQLSFGGWGPGVWARIFAFAVLSIPLAWLAVRSMKRRLVV